MEKQGFLSKMLKINKRNVHISEKIQKLKKSVVLSGEEMIEIKRKLSEWTEKEDEAIRSRDDLLEVAKNLRSVDKDQQTQMKLMKSTINNLECEIRSLTETIAKNQDSKDIFQNKLVLNVNKTVLGVYVDANSSSTDTYRGLMAFQQAKYVLPFEFSASDFHEQKSHSDSTLPISIPDNTTSYADLKSFMH